MVPDHLARARRDNLADCRGGRFPPRVALFWGTPRYGHGPAAKRRSPRATLFHVRRVNTGAEGALFRLD